MKTTQVAVIGAGPAGLAAAIEVAHAGGQVTVIDENAKPGGQLFKQIHKFSDPGSIGPECAVFTSASSCWPKPGN